MKSKEKIDKQISLKQIHRYREEIDGSQKGGSLGV